MIKWPTFVETQCVL